MCIRDRDNTNYEVTVKRGDFKIKEAKDPEAELKIAGGSWIYDGKEQKVKPVSYTHLDEVIRGLKEGEDINPADYAWDKDFLTYLGSSQDFVTVSGENDNQVDLY